MPGWKWHVTVRAKYTEIAHRISYDLRVCDT